MSDVHLDSTKCQRKLWKLHMDQLLEQNIPVVFHGDLLDMMQGAGDKRGHKGALIPELQGKDNYWQALVEWTAQQLAPYIKVIALFGYGNHETAAMKHHELDILQLLADKLELMTGTRVPISGYAGWLLVNMGGRRQRVCYFHHGAGGGAPVTGGVIEAQRVASQTRCDWIVMGHVHTSYTRTNPVAYVSKSGVPTMEMQKWVRSPGYKEELLEAHGMGWAVEKGHALKPNGFALLSCHRMKSSGVDHVELGAREVTETYW